MLMLQGNKLRSLYLQITPADAQAEMPKLEVIGGDIVPA
jgi:hypothetical protein